MSLAGVDIGATENLMAEPPRDPAIPHARACQYIFNSRNIDRRTDGGFCSEKMKGRNRNGLPKSWMGERAKLAVVSARKGTLPGLERNEVLPSATTGLNPGDMLGGESQIQSIQS